MKRWLALLFVDEQIVSRARVTGAAAVQVTHDGIAWSFLVGPVATEDGRGIVPVKAMLDNEDAGSVVVVDGLPQFGARYDVDSTTTTTIAAPWTLIVSPEHGRPLRLVIGPAEAN